MICMPEQGPLQSANCLLSVQSLYPAGNELSRMTLSCIITTHDTKLPPLYYNLRNVSLKHYQGTMVSRQVSHCILRSCMRVSSSTRPRSGCRTHFKPNWTSSTVFDLWNRLTPDIEPTLDMQSIGRMNI